MKIEQLQKIKDPDTLVNTLLDNAPQVVNDGAFDHLLVECFFPNLDESFKTREVIKDEEIENFKNSFDYSKVGITEAKKKELLNKIQKMKSIDRIISIIEKHIPEDLKKQIVAGHIKKVWIEQNYKGNLNNFISGLNKIYWNLE